MAFKLIKPTIYLAFIFFVSLTKLSLANEEADENPTGTKLVRAAFILKKLADRQNHYDINELQKAIRRVLERSGDSNKLTPEQIEKATHELQKDKALMESAVRLIPEEDLKALNASNIDDFSPLLEEARLFLEMHAENILAEDLSLELMKAQSSLVKTAKTALIYALFSVSAEAHLNIRNLKLAYPVKVSTQTQKLLENFLLLDSSQGTLYIPNSGFVHGGALLDGNFKGLDAGNFIIACIIHGVRQPVVTETIPQGEAMKKGDLIVIGEKILIVTQKTSNIEAVPVIHNTDKTADAKEGVVFEKISLENLEFQVIRIKLRS